MKYTIEDWKKNKEEIAQTISGKKDGDKGVKIGTEGKLSIYQLIEGKNEQLNKGQLSTLKDLNLSKLPFRKEKASYSRVIHKEYQDGSNRGKTKMIEDDSVIKKAVGDKANLAEEKMPMKEMKPKVKEKSESMADIFIHRKDSFENSKSIDKEVYSSSTLKNSHHHPPQQISRNKAGVNAKGENEDKQSNPSVNELYLLEKHSTFSCRNIPYPQLEEKEMEATYSYLQKALPHQELLSQKVYQLNKFRHLRNFRFSLNPKKRDRAGRIIQHWWWKTIDELSRRHQMAERIQCVWKGIQMRKKFREMMDSIRKWKAFELIMHKVTRKFTLNHYYHYLELRKKELLLLMLKLKLRLYCRRWSNKANAMKKREETMTRLVIMRKANAKIVELKGLYYHIWDIKIRHDIKKEHYQKEKSEQSRKQTSINNIMNGLDMLTKRKGLSLVSFKLNESLKRQASLLNAKTVLKAKTQMNAKGLRHYLNRWRLTAVQAVFFQSARETKDKRLMGLVRQRSKAELRRSLNRFKQGLISELALKLQKNQSQVIIPKAFGHLINVARRKGMQGISEYMRQGAIRKLLIHSVNSQEKRSAFKRYCATIHQLTNADRFNKIIRKHIHSSFKREEHICFLFYFNHWKWLSKEKEMTLLACKNSIRLTSSLERFINHLLIQDKDHLLHCLSIHVHANRKAKAVKMLFGSNSHYNKAKHNQLMSFYFHQWVKQVFNRHISDMKAKWLHITSKHYSKGKEEKALSRAFHSWRESKSLTKAQSEFKRHKQVINGTALLEKVMNRQLRKALNHLLQPKQLYMKGKVLSSISNIIKSQKSKLSKAFDIWKRYQMKEQFTSMTTHLTNKHHCTQLKTLYATSSGKASLKLLFRHFSKWRYRTIIIEKNYRNEFLSGLNEAVTCLSAKLNALHSAPLFGQLKSSHVNPSNSKLAKLKPLMQINDCRNLLQAWRQWQKYSHYQRVLTLKGKTLLRTNENVKENFTRRSLLKHFLYWKMFRLYQKRLTCDSLLKAFDYLNEGMIKPAIEVGIEAMKNKSNYVYKRVLARKILNRSNCKYSALLNDSFRKWLLVMRRIDMKTATVKVKAKVKAKETSIFRHYFNRWSAFTKRYPIVMNQIYSGGKSLNKALIKLNESSWVAVQSNISLPHKSKQLKAKVIPHSIFTFKEKMMHCFNQWRLHSEKKLFALRLSNKFLKASLLKRKKAEVATIGAFLQKWSLLSKCLKPSIAGHSLSSALLQNKEYLAKSILLRNISMRPYYQRWKDRCIELSHKENDQFIFKKIMTPMLRKTQSADIRYAFNQWHRCLSKQKENNYKQLFLKCHFIRTEKENEMRLLKKKLNQWNNISDFFAYKKEQLIQFPDQIVKLKRAICHNPKCFALNQLANHAFNKLKASSTLSIVTKKNSELNRRVLRNAVRQWHSKMISHSIASSNMKGMIQLARSMPTIRKQYDLMYLKRIKEIANAIYEVKVRKAGIIAEFTQRLSQISKQMNTMRRALTLRNRLNLFIVQDERTLSTFLSRWHRKATEIHLNCQAKIIQSFIKWQSLQKTTKASKTSIMFEALDETMHSAKLSAFDLMKFNSMQLPSRQTKMKMINKQTARVFKNKERIDNDCKLEYFNRWKCTSRSLQKIAAGQVIVMNMRKLRSKNLLRMLKQKRKALTGCVGSLMINQSKVLSLHSKKWNTSAHSQLINEKSRLIQAFLKEKLRSRIERRSLLNKHERISKGILDIDNVLNTNLILFNKSKIFKRLLDISKAEHCKTLLNNIPRLVTQYFHSRYFLRWKANTIEDARASLKKIQSSFKSHFNQKKAKKAIGTSKFLRKYIQKLDQDNAQMLTIAFLHYKKQVAKQRIDSPLINLQKNIKGFLMRKKALPKMRDEEKKCEKEMSRLTRKSKKTHQLLLKWEHPLLKYWIRLKWKNTREEIRKRLLIGYSIRNSNENEVITCIMRAWINKVKQLNAIDNAISIQRFLLPKLKRIMHSKGVNQMTLLARLQFNRKFLLSAKVHSLYKKLRHLPYLRLINGLDRNSNQLHSLSKLLHRKEEIDKDNIKKAFNAFSNTASLLLLTQKAKTIQRAIKTHFRENKIARGLCKFNQTLLTIGYDKIKSESNRAVIKQMAGLILQHILDVKRDCFQSLEKAGIDIHLNSLINVIARNNDICSRHYFDKWQRLSYEIKRMHSSSKILKTYIIYKENKHKKAVKTALSSIHVNLSYRYTSKVVYCFMKWKRNSQMAVLAYNAKVISSFVHKYYQMLKAKRNWVDNVLSLLKATKMNEIRQIAQKQKAVIVFGSIANSLNNRLKLTLKAIHQHNQSSALTKLISKNSLKSIQYNFSKWKLNDLFVQQVSTLNRTFLSLGDCYKNSIIRNKANSMSRIYKLFIYKILSRVFSSLTEAYYHQTGLVFYSQLQLLIKSKALYSYTKTSTVSKQPTVKEMPFRAIQSQKKTIDKRRYLLIITPLFRSYLVSKMSRVNAFTFNKILRQSLPYIFANHFRIFNKQQMHIQKKRLVTYLSSASKRLDLHTFVNDIIKDKLRDSMSIVIKRKKLFNFISKTMLNKTKAKKRVGLKTVLAWKGYVAFLKSQKRYLEALENSFAQIYEDFEDVFIGEGTGSSVIDELMTFNNKTNK